MHPQLATPIADTKEIDRLRDDAKNKGKTYEVTKVVFTHFSDQLNHKRVSSKELGELNKLLKAKISTAKRPGLARTCNCPHCSHPFTFTDFVRSAMSLSAHTRDQLISFILGPRYYLTVDTDAKRQLQCPECSKTFPGIFCCYTSSYYAYV